MYSPKIKDSVKGDKLLFKYAGITVIVYEDDGGIYLPANTVVKNMRDTTFLRSTSWLDSARSNYVTNNITLYNLYFDTRNRLATFIYGNAVQSTNAFFPYDDLECDAKEIVDNLEHNVRDMSMNMLVRCLDIVVDEISRKTGLKA